MFDFRYTSTAKVMYACAYISLYSQLCFLCDKGILNLDDVCVSVF